MDGAVAICAARWESLCVASDSPWPAAPWPTGETRLADVALLAGFADQSHFTRVFKRQLGLTPATYRKTTSSTSGRSKSKQSMQKAMGCR
jgi:AraC-like DNA-binding protein